MPGCDPEPDTFQGFVERPCRRQPLIADVFGPDGRYLGEVAIPSGMRFDVHPAIADDRVVAVVESPDGTLQVKRYELRIAP